MSDPSTSAARGQAVDGIRWARDHTAITDQQQLIDHPNRVVEVVDRRGVVTDRYRPRNLGGPMLKPARQARP